MATIATEKEPRTLMAVSSVKSDKGEEKIPRRQAVYPMSAERELLRVYLGIMNTIMKVSMPYVKRILSVYGAWEQENVRTDAKISVQDAMQTILDEYGADIQENLNIPRITKNVTRVGKYARTISVRDWKSLVDDALDMEIDEPFYMETTEDLVNKWAYENAQYISSYPEEYRNKIAEIIQWGFDTKQPMVNVYRRIEKLTGDTRSHARMIARDQMGTLNYQMTRYEHESMGVDKYKWITKLDNRVRECHRALHGKIFDWNNPPAQWYMTKGRGIVYTGQYAHPGQAYGCRCRANPVFNEKKVEAIVQPVAKKKKK